MTEEESTREESTISENEHWDYQHEEDAGHADGLAALEEPKARFEINDTNTANWYLKTLRNLENEKATVRAQTEAMLKALDADIHRLEFLYGQQFEMWVRGELARRGGKGKSLPLHQGTAAFRTVPRSFRVRGTTEALEYARQQGWDIIKPVIVTTEHTIVAGHQRTKAMQALGRTHCPAFILPPVGITDEVRFNQLHNASDLDFGDEDLWVPPGLTPGFHRVLPADIQASSLRVRNAPKKTEILRLLTKYGEWGSAVATTDGRIRVSGLYAMCCKILGRPCLVYVLPEGKAALLERYFGRPYGRFSYEHLPRTTYAQSLAQMMRLRPQKTGKLRKDGDPKGKSRTYEHLLLPRLRDLAGYGLPENPRILDFGAGQMDYVRRLRRDGVDGNLQAVDILGVEFFLRRGLHLDTGQAQNDVTALCDDLATRGRFDIVICDSVLNSVDSVQAESDVLTCLAALTRPGGLVIFSGRSRDAIERKETRQTTNTDPDTRYVHFLDENGLTAMYSNGVWRYQKFHTLPEIEQLTRHHFGERFRILDSDGRTAKSSLNASGWGVAALNDHHQPASDYLPALRREFDLPLPHGRRFGRSDDIEQAFLAALRLK